MAKGPLRYYLLRMFSLEKYCLNFLNFIHFFNLCNFSYLSNNHLKSKISMEDQKYVCDVCDWVYDPAKGDPDNGIAPGTAFADLPDDWVCPLCGVGKDEFSPID